MKLYSKITTNNLILVSILCLILVNILFRWPITPHELGNDSFFIHWFSQTILDNGSAKWLLHPLSFFGFFPYSYPSGVPHIIAIFSTVTGINSELSILISSATFSVIGVFSSFIFAGKICDKYSFKLLTAFFFSLSPLAIKFTQWTVSTRGLLIMCIPLILWSSIQLYQKRSCKYLILLFTLLFASLSVHRMAFILIPVILLIPVSYILYKIFLNFNRRTHIFFILLYLLFIAIIVHIQFPNLYTQPWVLEYASILNSMNFDQNYIVGLSIVIFARLGIIILLASLGFIYVNLQKIKSHFEWYIILCTLIFAPLYGLSMYFYQFNLIFFSILAVYGVIGIFSALDIIHNGKIRVAKHFDFPSYFTKILTGILVIVIIFSVFTLTIRYTSSYDDGHKNYMTESEYQMTEFINFNLADTVLDVKGTLPRHLAALTNNEIRGANEIQNLIYADSVTIDSLKLYPISISVFAIHNYLRHPIITNITIKKETKETSYVVKSATLRLPAANGNISSKIYSTDIDQIWSYF